MRRSFYQITTQDIEDCIEKFGDDFVRISERYKPNPETKPGARKPNVHYVQLEYQIPVSRNPVSYEWVSGLYVHLVMKNVSVGGYALRPHDPDAKDTEAMGLGSSSRLKLSMAMKNVGNARRGLILLNDLLTRKFAEWLDEKKVKAKKDSQSVAGYLTTKYSEEYQKNSGGDRPEDAWLLKVLCDPESPWFPFEPRRYPSFFDMRKTKTLKNGKTIVEPFTVDDGPVSRENIHEVLCKDAVLAQVVVNMPSPCYSSTMVSYPVKLVSAHVSIIELEEPEYNVLEDTEDMVMPSKKAESEVDLGEAVAEDEEDKASDCASESDLDIDLDD